MTNQERLGQGYIRDLGIQRRRYTLALFGLVLVSLVVVTADLTMFSTELNHTSTVIFSFTYNLLASLVVTALISRFVVQLSIQQFMNQANTNLSLLGIRPSPSLGRVAIVLSAIPVPAAHSVPVLSLEGVREALNAPSELYISEQVRKGLENLGAYAHSRRDILLITDLTRMMGDAGMDPPLIVSDVEFMNSINATSTARPFRKGIHLQDRSSEPYASYRVTNAVVIGLWSSVVTCSLADSADVPLTLADDAESRRILLRVPGSDENVSMDADPQAGGAGGVRTTPGVVSRFFFDDITLAVIGGTRGLGTARLGDLLDSRPQTCSLLWDLDYSLDLWAGVFCPGQGRRGEDFSLWATYTQRGLFKNRRIGDVISVNRDAQ